MCGVSVGGPPSMPGCQRESEETGEGCVACLDRMCDSNETFQSAAAATPINKPSASQPTDDVDSPVNNQP